MAYFDKTDVEKFLNITLSTPGGILVDQLIPAISDFVDSYCNRSWKNEPTTEITERFDGGEWSYFVSNPPISEIVSVKTGKTPSYAGDLLSVDEYYIYPTYIKMASKPVNIPRSVEIVYKSGATLPNDLKHAMVRWCSEIFKSQDVAGKTVQSMSAGPVSIQFVSQDGMPRFVEMVLNRYRLISL